MWEDSDSCVSSRELLRAEVRFNPLPLLKSTFPTWNSFDIEYPNGKGYLGPSKRLQSLVLWELWAGSQKTWF